MGVRTSQNQRGSGLRINWVVAAALIVAVGAVALAVGIAVRRGSTKVASSAVTVDESVDGAELVAAPNESPMRPLMRWPSSVNDGQKDQNAPDLAIKQAVEQSPMSPEKSARLRADRALMDLEQSGPASAGLTSGALKTFEALKSLSDLAGAEFSDFRCYRGGCAFTMTSGDASSAANFADALVRSKVFLSWPGPKFRSGPLRTPSGQIQAAVILQRNPESSSTTNTEETP